MTATETVPCIGTEQVTINLTGVRTEWLVPLAQAADRLGFGAVSVGDSIFYPQESDSRYPYNSTGDRTFLESIAMPDRSCCSGILRRSPNESGCRRR